MLEIIIEEKTLLHCCFLSQCLLVTIVLPQREGSER
uniref:Uncharacterized protein n=1 Tax=Anguilla anguilla TaxID=7936 RepID=A0A0E9RQ72_ANGAN